MCKKYLIENNGFTLVELVIVIIIMGILALAGVRAISKSGENAKYQSTLREMESLKIAIVGDERLIEGGKRVSFGYVGDVGQLPPTLQDIVSNVSSKPNWKGPYMAQNFTDNPNDYLYDGWNSAYTYNIAAASITSGGGGTAFSINLVKTQNPDDLEKLEITGIVTDRYGNVPIPTDVVNIHIDVTLANGTNLPSINPGTDGMYTVQNVPIGVQTVVATHDSVTGFSPEFWTYQGVRVYPIVGGQQNVKFNQTLPGW